MRARINVERARAKTRPMSMTMMTVSLARPIERGRRSSMKGGRAARGGARERVDARRGRRSGRGHRGWGRDGWKRGEDAGVAFERVVAPLVEKTTTLNEGIAKFYDDRRDVGAVVERAGTENTCITGTTREESRGKRRRIDTRGRRWR